MRLLARARIAETSRTHRDINLIGLGLDIAVIEQLAVLIVEIDRDRAAALDGILRSVEMDQRLAAAVMQAEQLFEQPISVRNNSVMDRVNAHRLDVLQPDLNAG